MKKRYSNTVYIDLQLHFKRALRENGVLHGYVDETETINIKLHRGKDGKLIVDNSSFFENDYETIVEQFITAAKLNKDPERDMGNELRALLHSSTFRHLIQQAINRYEYSGGGIPSADRIKVGEVYKKGFLGRRIRLS